MPLLHTPPTNQNHIHTNPKNQLKLPKKTARPPEARGGASLRVRQLGPAVVHILRAPAAREPDSRRKG